MWRVQVPAQARGKAEMMAQRPQSHTRLFVWLVAASCGALTCACKGEKAKESERADPKQIPVVSSYGLTPEQSAQVLVKVGDTKITLGEFADRLGSQSPYLRARYHSPERRREFLENMVRFELLANEAEKRGYEKSDDVERVRKQVMVQQMMQDLFDKGGLKLSDVSDAEIKAYYDANATEFDKPAQVRVSHILFKDKAHAELALNALKQAPADMELFRKLASRRRTPTPPPRTATETCASSRRPRTKTARPTSPCGRTPCAKPLSASARSATCIRRSCRVS